MKGLRNCKNFECDIVPYCPYTAICKSINKPYGCLLTDINTCSDCKHWNKDCKPSMYVEAEKEKQTAE